MDPISKTLYIPLYGKACVSRRKLFLTDVSAEKIWAEAGFPLSGKSASKWLALYMGMRSAVFDKLTLQALTELPEALVLHIGCGLDSRYQRIGCPESAWYDIDFPEVIEERRRFFQESAHYRMLPADMCQEGWKAQIPGNQPAIVIMEGVSMYFPPEALEGLLTDLKNHFSSVRILMDCYSTFAAKASKFKNPINDVGVTTVYGLDDPVGLAERTGYVFAAEHDMTPTQLIALLNPGERVLFSSLYGGKFARRLYRMYEFHG